MQRNILQGSEFLLYNIDNEPVAYSTNCVLKINQNLSDVTHKDSDSWSEFMASGKNWSIDFDGLVSYGEGFNTSFFLNKYQNSEPFFVKFGVIQEGFTHAFVGEVNIESIEQTADDGEVVSYSGTLKGVGNLSFQDEGTPIQNGYLKVESDPIFRGSPAFNISEDNKQDWNQAYSKIVNELEFSNDGELTTLKIKFKDGTAYSSSFKPIVGTVDLSGYYTKAQADSKILTAQVAADSANSMLTAIASDSKLAPAEKISVLKEWQIIQDEKPKIVNQAAVFKVDTLNYDVAFIELDEYLEPLLRSMITTDTIAGYDFRAYFRNYYDQKILILKDIAEASKLYTDAEIEAITIGNRNYQLNGDKTVTVNQNVNQLLQSGNYPINTQFALSFYARSVDASNQLHLEFQDSVGVDFNVSSAWLRYTCLLTCLDVPKLYARIGQGISVLNIYNLGATSSVDAFPYLFPSEFTGSGALPVSSSSFPYKFPISFDAANAGGIQMKNIMVVAGNKPVDFVPAPEDFYGLIFHAKKDAENASKAYTQAQRTLTELEAQVYADNVVTEAEARLLADAEAKLDAAKKYSETLALRAKVLADAYADGRIDEIEEKLISASDTNIQLAKAYTDSQTTLSEINIKSWADGRIDTTEAALIQNAENNLYAAKLYSDAQDLYTKTLSDAYADHLISQEEQKRIDAVQASLVAAKDYSETQRILSETIIKAYADNQIDAIEAALIQNAENNLAAAKLYSDQQNLLTKTLSDAYTDKKITDEEQSRIDAIEASLVAAKTYTEAQRVLSETIIKAYADGVVDAEEARAIEDATNKMNQAKAYADSTALALKSELKDYVDTSIVDKANEIIASTTGLINVNNTAILQQAKSDAESKIEIARLAAISASNGYTTAQRIAAETTAQVYADGIVTLEEQARLTQAANNLAAAKLDATEKSNTAAEYGIAAQNLHNALVGNLKSLAYTDVVEVSKLGSTVVQGGFLKTSLLDANYIRTGIVNADYIKTLDLQTNQLSTTGVNKITLNQNNDNMLKFRHPNGVVGIEIGIVSGQLKIIFYDTNGLIVWEGGKSGIIYINEIPEAWVTLYRNQISIGDDFYDVNGSLYFDGEDLRPLVSRTTGGGLAMRGDIITEDGVTYRQYRLNRNQLSASYLYQAGNNAQAAANSVFTGIHTSQSKSLSNWVEDGWYLEDSSDYSYAPLAGHIFQYSLVAVKNGKDIGRVTGQIQGLALPG